MVERLLFIGAEADIKKNPGAGQKWTGSAILNKMALIRAISEPLLAENLKSMPLIGRLLRI